MSFHVLTSEQREQEFHYQCPMYYECPGKKKDKKLFRYARHNVKGRYGVAWHGLCGDSGGLSCLHRRRRQLSLALCIYCMCWGQGVNARREGKVNGRETDVYVCICKSVLMSVAVQLYRVAEERSDYNKIHGSNTAQMKE